MRGHSGLMGRPHLWNSLSLAATCSCLPASLHNVPVLGTWGEGVLHERTDCPSLLGTSEARTVVAMACFTFRKSKNLSEYLKFLNHLLIPAWGWGVGWASLC